MIFQPNYSFFGNNVRCVVVETNKRFKLEVPDVYPWVKEYYKGWKFLRTETPDQRGMPDLLLLQGDKYLMIEAKVLKQKKLVKLEDNLTWQFGQIAFMKRALTLGLSYKLVVAKDNLIAFIGA
jgi:hypothetical protein